MLKKSKKCWLFEQIFKKFNVETQNRKKVMWVGQKMEVVKDCFDLKITVDIKIFINAGYQILFKFDIWYGK